MMGLHLFFCYNAPMTNAAEILQENTSLKEIISEKNTVIALHEKIIQQKDSKIKFLEEYVQSLKRKQFGSSSEKLDAIQPDLFTEAEDTEATNETVVMSEETDNTVIIAEHTRAKKRVSIPADLPRVVIIHDLPEHEKVCPHDGTVLTCIGHESHEQLEIIPAKVQVLQHNRLKYACSCCGNHLAIASKPAQPIEKSIAAPGLLATIAVQKYADALPLYRQAEIFKRINLELDRATLANWMIKCGQLIQPLINLLHEKMIEESILHMDETRVQVLSEPDRKAQAQSFMWVLRSTMPTCAAVLFHYEPSRAGKVVNDLLEGFSGALMVDGFPGYNRFCENNNIIRLGCWAHARRKFIEAQQKQPKGKTGKADQALAYIQQLYRIEQSIKEKTSEEKFDTRQRESQPIIDKLQAWLITSKEKVPPGSSIGQAVHYLYEQWPHLINYLRDGRYPIDNNPAENAIRPFVIGRKNWLFSVSQQGAKASANLYSLIETAKANNLEPYAYLKKVFTELPNAKTIEDIDRLLPWKLNASSVKKECAE
jgi:transposase